MESSGALLEEVVVYGKECPYMGKVVERRRLTGEGSDKVVDHVVVDITGSGMDYGCGDSLGVIAPNREDEVAWVLEAVGLSGAERVELKKVGEVSLEEGLRWHLALDKPSKKFYEYCGGVERVDIGEYLDGCGVLDVLRDTGFKAVNAQELVGQMRRLVPRLYSVASSPMVGGGRVDLTVGLVHYESHGRERWGVASGYLSEVLEVGSEIGVYVAKSHFKMPEDSDVDMIMVGPGTGVAPFRGFLQEKGARGGEGRAWLFFGDRTREHEYLYGGEWDVFMEAGVLDRLDLAFSRDQVEKVYVQDLMKAKGSEVWEWIEGGGHFYVCGDMKRMAKDVDVTLHEIVMEYGGYDEAGAKDYVKGLKKAKRYQRDVY